MKKGCCINMEMNFILRKSFAANDMRSSATNNVSVFDVAVMEWEKRTNPALLLWFVLNNKSVFGPCVTFFKNNNMSGCGRNVCAHIWCNKYGIRTDTIQQPLQQQQQQIMICSPFFLLFLLLLL